MEIYVFIERENSTKAVSVQGNTVHDLLKEVKINPETVIVVRRSEVITEKELLQDQDQLELLSVISGG